VRELDGDDGSVHVAVGTVVSRTMVVVAVAADAGPVLVAESLAPLAAKTGVTVPALQPDTITVRDEPESLPGVNEQLVAVPALEKSPARTPVTLAENTRVKLNDAAFVGVDCAEVNDDTLGAVTSRVMVVVSVAADAGPVLVAESLAPLAAKTGVTVPALQPDTVTVRDEPESLPGSNEQPVAVPVLEKSPAATPVTVSENVSV
jgi:hypothetical protein